LLLSSTHKKVLPLLLVWAALVSFSRIYLGVHYPLDVIGGALFGALISVFIYMGAKNWLLKSKGHV
jgi:undecaprenyl-diphosphatase